MFPRLFLVVVFSSVSVFCANILYLETIPSPSHHVWNGKMARSLVEKGHNVTLLGPDYEHFKGENFTFIYMEGVYEELAKGIEPLVRSIHYSTYEMVMLVYNWIQSGCKGIYNSKGLQTLLDYPKDYKFDLIIVDVSVGECLHPVIKRFNYPPTVGMSIYLLPSPVAYKFGNPIQPAYIPNHNVLASTTMTFWERVLNFFTTYLDIYLTGRGTLIENLANEKFKMDQTEINNVTRHISLVLANVDPVLSYPQPLQPHIINVGGLHTGDSKPLPKEYSDILNSAKNGVIVFSLGTNVYSADMDDKKIKAFLNAFEKLPYTVLWKFEKDLKDKPKNVIIRKWFPQGDILGHPNVKLFIGHGGALSTQEALYHAVPLILIPFMLDQRVNTKIIVEKNIALALDYRTLTEKDVTEAIEEVLNNPQYRENVQEISRTFKDQPETPLERAHFWVNYVLKHKGAPYLSSKSRDLSFIVASSLDVFILVLSILSFLCFIFYKVSIIINYFNKNIKSKIL